MNTPAIDYAEPEAMKDAAEHLGAFAYIAQPGHETRAGYATFGSHIVAPGNIVRSYVVTSDDNPETVELITAMFGPTGRILGSVDHAMSADDCQRLACALLDAAYHLRLRSAAAAMLAAA